MPWCLDNVGVTYRLEDGSRVAALNGINLTIGAGERIALVGGNGSGKSTLARVLGGIIQPTTGRFTVDGSDDGAVGTAALVLQNPGDNIIGQTVREELDLTLGGRQDGSASSNRSALLSRFGLSHLLDRNLSELSGGETQLVALVCGLLSGRRIVVLDEPTSHLDPPSRRLLLDHLLCDDSDDSTPDPATPAVVFVTQYREEARRFSRVIELSAGQVTYDGAPDGLAPAAVSPHSGEDCTASDAEQPTILAVRGLSKHQDGMGATAPILSDVTLTVRAGDTIGLVGPIGSGKTTLGYHLAGLLARHGGTVEYGGSITTSRPPVVLIQFPERQLFAETVLEDVGFGIRNRGIADEEADVLARRSLDAVGLPAEVYEGRSPFSLSGGQKRRAALASVAVCGAELYILDEPTSSLDSEGLTALEGQLCQWRKSGIAYIVISHDLEWLRRVTRRVWIMSAGRVIADVNWAAPECNAALAKIEFLP
ncbi:MAG: hypothetical protein Kow0074_24920 [Candidatus Zixiibacteriota bacterium]